MSVLDKVLVVAEGFEDLAEEVEESPERFIIKVQQSIGLPEAIESCVNLLKRREMELEGVIARIKPLIDELQSEIKFHSDRLEYAKKVLMFLVPPGRDSSYVNELVSIFYTASESTEVFDPEAVPIEYLEFSEPKPSVSKIKEALKASKNVPGARTVVKYNLRIGAGGERGKLNESNRKKSRAKKIIETEAVS